jgi:adenosylmethionine-8-amino-7-oxononanoate aminotransferase
MPGSIRGRVLRSRAQDNLPTVAYGEGVWLVDTSGRRYLDGSSGAVAANLGHGQETIAQVLYEQARTIAFAHRTQFTNPHTEHLAELLARWTGGALTHAVFVNSGSEAIEGAIQLAYRFWTEHGQATKTEVVSRQMSYHGATLGARSAGGNPARRAPFQPLLRPWPHVHPPYCYRCPLGRTPDYCASACADDLEETIVRLGPEHVAAFIAEPITGSSAGALTPPSGYYERVREICDRYQVLWIADEVMTGCGRTGTAFGYQHWRTAPDILAFGKGISGGYMPLAGVLCTPHVAEAIKPSLAGLQFGHTYSNTPLPAAVGVAAVSFIEEHRLIERARIAGDRLHTGLQDLAGDPDVGCVIGEVRGRGLMQAIELVRDRATREPFAAGLGVTSRLVAACRRHGLLLYPAGGGIDGYRGDAVLVTPPLIIADDETDELLARLRAALHDLRTEIRAEQHAHSGSAT